MDSKIIQCLQTNGHIILLAVKFVVRSADVCEDPQFQIQTTIFCISEACCSNQIRFN